ncbi:unnamed protein product [Caenorhabditis brenneri]
MKSLLSIDYTLRSCHCLQQSESLFTCKWKATSQCGGTMNIGCSPPYFLIGPKQMNEEHGIRMRSSLIFDLLPPCPRNQESSSHDLTANTCAVAQHQQ